MWNIFVNNILWTVVQTHFVKYMVSNGILCQSSGEINKETSCADNKLL